MYTYDLSAHFLMGVAVGSHEVATHCGSGVVGVALLLSNMGT